MIIFKDLIQIENFSRYINYVSKLIKNKMHGILKISSKKAATRGTTRYALSEYPYLFVTELIFAKAFGVAPKPCPNIPLIITAAS